MVDSSNRSGCIVLGANAIAIAAAGNGQLVIGSASTPINTSNAVRTGGASAGVPGTPVLWMQLVFNGNIYYQPLYS
jgi:hypothetical protein